jgi:hypothetical protein
VRIERVTAAAPLAAAVAGTGAAEAGTAAALLVQPDSGREAIAAAGDCHAASDHTELNSRALDEALSELDFKPPAAAAGTWSCAVDLLFGSDARPEDGEAGDNAEDFTALQSRNLLI